MKTSFKTLLYSAAISATALFSAFAMPQGEVCIKVKNDTGASVTLHTGKGTAPMNSGTVKEFCLEEGSKLYFADKGQKGKAIITFTAKDNKTTIKLSDYR